MRNRQAKAVFRHNRFRGRSDARRNDVCGHGDIMTFLNGRLNSLTLSTRGPPVMTHGGSERIGGRVLARTTHPHPSCCPDRIGEVLPWHLTHHGSSGFVGAQKTYNKAYRDLTFETQR